MTDIFLYGSLLDDGLRAVVFAADVALRPAQLDAHRVVWGEGQDFPLLQVAAGHVAQGAVVTVTDDVLARMDFYEGGFGYELRDVTFTDGSAAQAWFPRGGLWQAGAQWSLADWQAQHGALSREAAREVMDYMGRYSPEDVLRFWHMIRVRASARVAAAGRVVPSWSGMTRDDVALDQLHRPYTNFFAMEEYDLRFRRFDGSMSEEINRGVFVASDAALVLPYDPLRDRVMVIEQFRAGPYGRGDAAPWPLEPVAGRVDPGETPETAARREAEEEAGLTLTGLEKIAEGYSSPGSSSEYFYVYLGLADLPDAAQTVAGKAEEAEDIRSHVLDWDVFAAMMQRGELTVLPLVLAAGWLAMNRDRLRSQAGTR